MHTGAVDWFFLIPL